MSAWPARLALSLLFLLLTLQGGLSLAARLLGGGGDQLHPALHLASGVAGLALLARPSLLAGYARGFGAGYFALGALGALLALSPPWLPLGTADHVFHVGLGLATLALGIVLTRKLRAAP